MNSTTDDDARSPNDAAEDQATNAGGDQDAVTHSTRWIVRWLAIGLTAGFLLDVTFVDGFFDASLITRDDARGDAAATLFDKLGRWAATAIAYVAGLTVSWLLQKTKA